MVTLTSLSVKNERRIHSVFAIRFEISEFNGWISILNTTYLKHQQPFYQRLFVYFKRLVSFLKYRKDIYKLFYNKVVENSTKMLEST